MWTIAETLAQDVIWVTQDGRRVLITEMDQSHRLNTRAYLLRRAAELREHCHWLRLRETIRGLRVDERRRLTGQPFMLELESDPEKWLLSTPFMTALDRAIRAHGVEDGEVVSVRYDEWIGGVDETRMIG